MIAALLIASSMTVTYPYLWAPGKVDLNCDAQDICPHLNPQTRKRPSTVYTRQLKIDQLNEHPEIDCSNGCEEDHVVSIELCGDLRDPANLAPEPQPEAREKDRVEDWLHHQVCAGDMSLDEAQILIRTDWRAIQERLQKENDDGRP